MSVYVCCVCFCARFICLSVCLSASECVCKRERERKCNLCENNNLLAERVLEHWLTFPTFWQFFRGQSWSRYPTSLEVQKHKYNMIAYLNKQNDYSLVTTACVLDIDLYCAVSILIFGPPEQKLKIGWKVNKIPLIERVLCTKGINELPKQSNTNLFWLCSLYVWLQI